MKLTIILLALLILQSFVACQDHESVADRKTRNVLPYEVNANKKIKGEEEPVDYKRNKRDIKYFYEILDVLGL